MAESPPHARLVERLVRRMETDGIEITHIAGDASRPDPPRVGRHEPDVIGRRNGVRCFGEAKTGNGDLGTAHSGEQFADFALRVHTPSGRKCPFYLCVPASRVTDARIALSDAGVDPSLVRIVSVLPRLNALGRVG